MGELTLKELLEMKLHESARIDASATVTKVTRVPGGWIYTFWEGFEDENGCALTATFVPEPKQ